MGSERRYELWLPRRVNRRQLILGAGAAALFGGLAGCGGDDDDEVATDTSGGAARRRYVGRPAGTTAGTSAGTAAPAGEGVPGGTFRLGLVGSTNDIIDGQYIVAKGDQARLVAGWETLVNYDDQFNISYEHGLAEEIETVAADNYVIHLKEGITFHDGKPVTADDVIYSFERRLDPELALSPTLIEFLDASGLTKVDDLTVEVKLLKPRSPSSTGLPSTRQPSCRSTTPGSTATPRTRSAPDRSC